MKLKSWMSIIVAAFALLRGATVYAEVCSVEGDLRLAGFQTPGAGRVEICHNGVWGTICADDLDTPWSEKNAQVVCRALGYSGALNSILHNTMPEANQAVGSVPIHYSGVRCTGEQGSLLQCQLSEITTGCTHQRDAAIVCRLNERVGHVRLVGDARDEVGAVELYHPQTGWTGICADPDHARYWLEDDQAARVVCRQLGYLQGEPYIGPLDSTRFNITRQVSVGGCDIDEDFDLTQCNMSVLPDACSTDDVAWVQCILGNDEYGDASKVGSRREGVMQLEFNGRMGHICDTGWDNVDAEVACVEFGLDDARTNYDPNPEGNYSKYISDLMPIWVTDVRCTTTTKSDGDGGSRTEVNENDVIDCEISNSFPVGFTDCNIQLTRSRIALVDCGTPQDPGRIAGIVLGVLSPFLIVGGIVLFFYLRLKCCNDCSCRCFRISVGECCSEYCRAPISWYHHMRRICNRGRRVHFRRSNDSAVTTSQPTHTTTAGISDVEMAPAGLFPEPQGDEPEPTHDTDLTMAAPPTYSEATSYATVQEKTVQSPLPDYPYPQPSLDAAFQPEPVN